MRTRTGERVRFDRARIVSAATRAARETGGIDEAATERSTDRVLEALRRRGGEPTVEEIQDEVERALLECGLAEVQRAFHAYRTRQAEARRAKEQIGVTDELKLSVAAVAVLSERYLRRDEQGQVVESTLGMLDRVASRVAAAEPRRDRARWHDRFRSMMQRLEFLPNSPTLMNAGTPLRLLSGCFVLPIEDSLPSIFTALGDAAMIHQAGAGTGFSFSTLRPTGDVIRSTGGRSSGPVSFIGLHDVASKVVAAGGKRRVANMAVLDVSHPDIEDFVTAKASDAETLSTFNLSVSVTDRFLRAASRHELHDLINPRNGRVVRKISARGLLSLIAEAAWRTGEPGLLFVDAVNRANPLPQRGRIEATNPCGEVPLLPGESCNLGSVNLVAFVENGRLDLDRLDAVICDAIRFLDDVIDVTGFPSRHISRATRASSQGRPRDDGPRRVPRPTRDPLRQRRCDPPGRPARATPRSTWPTRRRKHWPASVVPSPCGKRAAGHEEGDGRCGTRS